MPIEYQRMFTGEAEVACFSPDRRYRYWLKRHTDPRGQRGKLLFVMLNPSTADETVDDPTVRRCRGFAKDLGYSELWVCNIFALRSTSPRALWTARDPIGSDNDSAIFEAAVHADRIICAWGIYGRRLGRGKAVECLLRAAIARWNARASSLYTLGLTKSGQPKHPLYLRRDTIPQPWNTKTDCP